MWPKGWDGGTLEEEENAARCVAERRVWVRKKKKKWLDFMVW